MKHQKESSQQNAIKNLTLQVTFYSPDLEISLFLYIFALRT